MDDFVSLLLLPSGLIAIMYSLGLSLNLVDFQRLLQFPRALYIGLLGQFIGMPTIAFILALALGLRPELAVSLVVIAACPIGVTSNALVFLGRADVALSVAMTMLSSLVCILSIPPLVMLALRVFYHEAEMPYLDVGGTILKLFYFVAPPILAGLATRILLPALAMRLLLWLRPTAFGVLLTIIAYLALVNWDLTVTTLLAIAPIAFLMNIIAMALGLWLGQRFLSDARQKKTLIIEFGVKNATMATFIAVAVLDRVDVAAAPTIYGVIMMTNALGLIALTQRYRMS